MIQLNRNEVQIWKVVIDDPIVLEDCKAVLTEAELKRADFFKFEGGKNQYIVSQGMLRILLSSYLNIPFNQVKIGRHPKGKPYSLDDSSLFFNTSNSGGLCVFGFSRDGEVGIDLEKFREVDELEDLIARNFTTTEIAYIRKKPEEELSRFFRFWTIKEGYLKAIGEGMRLTPDNLEFRIDRDKVTLISKKGIFEYDDWILDEFTPCDGFTGTIVYKNDKATITQNWYKDLKYN